MIFFRIYDKIVKEVIGLDIGKKIKKLRCEKFMTQAELAGNNITRNMLSCIENGTALPSLATLRYLASKLNVSAGYLLADEVEEQNYVKMEEMANIKNAYLSKNFKICRDICVETPIELDDEMNLIFAESSLSLGIESFNRGKLRVACEYFDEAMSAAEKTVYNTDRLVAIASAYFRYMARISATLSSDVVDEDKSEIFAALSDDFSRYVIAFELTEEGNITAAEKLMERVDENLPYSLHIKAKRSMLEGKYDEAYRALYLILINPYKIQEPFMYFVFCDLEVCCKEIKNFKGAYEYSNDKLEMLQKMLSEA